MVTAHHFLFVLERRKWPIRINWYFGWINFISDTIACAFPEDAFGARDSCINTMSQYSPLHKDYGHQNCFKHLWMLLGINQVYRSRIHYCKVAIFYLSLLCCHYTGCSPYDIDTVGTHRSLTTLWYKSVVCTLHISLVVHLLSCFFPNVLEKYVKVTL